MVQRKKHGGGNRSGRVTIKDVSVRAGVSPMTVSNVINNSARVRPRTRLRVLQAIQELGYHPNTMARRLVRQEAGAFGLFIPFDADHIPSNPFFAQLIRGILDFCRPSGYTLSLLGLDSSNDGGQDAANFVHEKWVDGLILTDPRAGDSLLANLVTQGVPAVVLGRPDVEGITYVDVDNVQVGYAATNYLLELGHRRIGFMGDSTEHTLGVDRFRGYRLALEQAAVTFRPEWMMPCGYMAEDGYRAGHALLQRCPDLTAVVCNNDLIALGVIKSARESGRSVPQELSVVGANDLSLVDFFEPALTTVQLPIYELGRTAARMLLERIRADDPDAVPPTGTLLPTRLIVRKSTYKVNESGRRN